MSSLSQIIIAIRNKLLIKGAENSEFTLFDAYRMVTNPTLSEQMTFAVIEELADAYINSSDQTREHIKKRLDEKKKTLPIFLLSGFTPNGHGNGHRDKFKYNGIVQLDVDFKRQGGRELAARFKELISSWDKLIFGGKSPSGVGFKGVVSTTNTDMSVHLEVSKVVWRQAVDHIRSLDPDFAAILENKDPHDDLQYGNACYLWADSIPFNHNAKQIVIDTQEMQSLKEVQEEALSRQFTNTCDDEFRREIMELLKQTRVNHNTWFTIVAAMKNSGFTIEDAKYVTAWGLKPNELNEVADVWKRSYAGLRIGTLIYHLKNIHGKEVISKIQAAARQRAEITKTIAKQARCNFTLGVGEYLGTHGIAIKETIESLDGTVELVAPTGTGKTKFMIHSWVGVKRVLCFPTNALITQTIADESKNLNIAQFNGNAKTIDFDSECIVTNYASLALLAERLKTFGLLDKFTLFIDEAHNLVTTMDYQAVQINQIAEVCGHFKKTVLVTATPVHAYDARIQPNETVIVKQQQPQPKHLVTHKGSSIDALAQIVRARQQDKETFAIFLNNTKEESYFGKVKSLLENNNISFTEVNAKTKDEQGYKTVVADGSMNGVQAVVATCILKEGVSIRENTSRTVHVIMLGAWSPEETAQCAARFRSADQVIVHRFTESVDWDKVPKVSRHSIGGFCANAFKQNLSITQLVFPSEESAGLMSTILGSKCFNFLTKRMDWLELGFEAYTASKRFANHYPRVMESALLNEYGFTSSSWEDVIEKVTAEDLEGHSANSAKIKEAKLSALVAASESMMGKTLIDLEEIENKTEVTKEWAELYSKVKQLAAVTDVKPTSTLSELVTWIREVAKFKTGRVNRMCNRVAIRRAKNDQVSLIKGKTLKSVVDQVYARFGDIALIKGRRKVTKTQALEILKSCDLSIFNIDTKTCKWTGTRVTQILEMFFKVKVNSHNREELFLSEYTDQDFVSFEVQFQVKRDRVKKANKLESLLDVIKN